MIKEESYYYSYFITIIINRKAYMRAGIGYDVHRLVKDRDLIIGGIKIPYEKGLLGHSDADVLTHAIIDSILGAAGLGDIGRHFPDTDEKYKGVSSIDLLKEVKIKVEEKLYFIENIDATIVAQKPKMGPYLPSMIEKISSTLGIDPDCINIKATTEEGLGVTGKGEGISSQAICMLGTIDNYQYYTDNSRQEDRNCGGCGGCPRHSK